MDRDSNNLEGFGLAIESLRQIKLPEAEKKAMLENIAAKTPIRVPFWQSLPAALRGYRGLAVGYLNKLLA
jgi:hypothetical protein